MTKLNLSRSVVVFGQLDPQRDRVGASRGDVALPRRPDAGQIGDSATVCEARHQEAGGRPGHRDGTRPAQEGAADREAETGDEWRVRRCAAQDTRAQSPGGRPQGNYRGRGGLPESGGLPATAHSCRLRTPSQMPTQRPLRARREASCPPQSPQSSSLVPQLWPAHAKHPSLWCVAHQSHASQASRARWT